MTGLREQHVWHVRGFDKYLTWHSFYFSKYEDGLEYMSCLSSLWRKISPVVVFDRSLAKPK